MKQEYFSESNAIISDLDGTLSIATSRRYNNFEAVGSDQVCPVVRNIIDYASNQGKKIIYITGRPEVCRDKTLGWIKDVANLPVEMLLMRPNNNYEEDKDIKFKLYNEHVLGRYAVSLVLEDKRSVVDMWRGLGLVCFEVANNEK